MFTSCELPGQTRLCVSRSLVLGLTGRWVSAVPFVGPCLQRTSHPTRLDLRCSGKEVPRSICICVLSRSAQASLSGQVHQRMRHQLTPCRSCDLVQLPLVNSMAPSSHACLAPSSVRSASRCQLSSWPTRKCLRSFHCCFVLLFCTMRHRSAAAPLWDASAAGTTRDGPISEYNLGVTALPALPACLLVASRQRTQLFNLRIRVLVMSLTVHPHPYCVNSILQVHWDLDSVSFIHNASRCPGESQLVTCLCESRHKQ